jgi:hypothetical protein
METGDGNLILSFSISIVLNIAVILALLLFTDDQHQDDVHSQQQQQQPKDQSLVDKNK